MSNERSETEQEKKERIAKQLNQIVCICKGIKLKTILKAAKESKTIADVNSKTGSGSGGCHGTRCGPKINALLKRLHGDKD